MPRKSSSGVGVVSAALSGTDRAGTKRGIKCIGAEPDKNSRAPMPAQIKRACRDFYMPRRNSTADRERDQKLLSEIPVGLPAEEVAERVEQIKTRRAKEISVKDCAEHGPNIRASPAIAEASAESVEQTKRRLTK